MELVRAKVKGIEDVVALGKETDGDVVTYRGASERVFTADEVAERDHICDENKVRVRRQIIRETRLTTNPRALGTKEIIEDRLVNFGDVTQEPDDAIRKMEEDCKKRTDELQANLDRAEKSLEQCQWQKFDVEQQLAALKARGWWQRLWNKS